jgi:TetR/AcrR family transcriptional repressor of nem operon
MARPRKSDQTREDLLAVGTELLTSHGYHGTGIKQILDAVGVPKGSFYNFFPSKEAFVAEVIQHYGERVVEEIERATEGLEREPSLVQLWCSFQNKVQHKVDAGQSCACLLGAMSAEIAQASSACREAIEAVECQWIEQFRMGIQLAQEQGDLRDDIAAENLAPALYNSWQGNLLQYQVSGNPNDLLRHLWTFFSTLMTTQGQLTFANSSACRREIHYDK